ncbi:MAG: hypothetical protein LBB83_00885 [Treponema sp.]|jgi:hypothetical protein|nr:hypothetical protein [Treponema sp.]
MPFISDKWRDSSVLTKAATFAMALNTLLTLVCQILILSIDNSSVGGKIIWLLLTVGVQTLLTFGIFKVNRIAKFFTMLQGWCGLLVIIFYIVSLKALTSATGTGALMGLVVNLINMIIPAEAKALIVLFLSPTILQILSLLILFGCGKDFAKVKRAAA